MALLQIAEPGMSMAPHEHKLAIGIDLGTTNSLVASVKSSISEAIPDEDGVHALPSVVRYMRDGSVIVGREALLHQSEDPLNTVSSAKRLIGRTLDDVSGDYLPYKLKDNGRILGIETCQGVKTPIEVSAEILRNLAARAEKALGGEIFGAVITVPAYFDDAQRQATKDAALMVGLKVLRLINEPTAAVIAYGLDEKSSGNFVVYDLGGGTFDVSVLSLQEGLFRVLATSGNSQLGGDDFDQRLYCHLLEKLSIERPEKSDARLLLSLCRKAKEELTDKEEALLEARLSTGGQVSYKFTRAEFQELTANLVQKTLDPVRKALRDAKLDRSEVDGVIMVGGATRMPHVKEAVGKLFGKEPLTNLDPDKVVAIGAAIQANLLAGNKGKDDYLLLDVTPLSLGVETYGGLVEKIIPRNSTIPVAKAQDFTTFKDGQGALMVHVLQGERELVSDCRSLAQFVLRGIPPMAAGAARIRITFQVDADGLLSVSAKELTTGVEQSVEVKPSYGLNDEEIANMLKDAMSNASDDAKARSLREAVVNAESVINAVEVALDEDGNLLSDDERGKIEATMENLKAFIKAEGNSSQDVRSKTDELVRATDKFAAMRMDHKIKQALKGKSVEDVDGKS